MTVDDVMESTPHLRAWTVKVRKGEGPEIVKALGQSWGAKGVEFVALRADTVFGSDHVRSALYHAQRAIKCGSNASDSLSMETLLYASGERQLSSAIKKMSVGRDCEEVVVAQLSPGSIEPDHGWQVLPPRRNDVDMEAFKRFGIPLSTKCNLDLKIAHELVLEKVASVDVFKK